MIWIKNRLKNNEILSGVFLNSGLGFTAEIAGKSGFDWVLIDTEHGLGGYYALSGYLQSARVGNVSSIVRVIANRSEYFKQALDLGACGIMVPQINTPEEAEQAVSYMKYPPEGERGITRSCWAAGFGFESQEYFEKANKELALIIQIETIAAMDNLDRIAAIDGVDCLFAGPSDLSCSLGLPCDLADKEFREQIMRIALAAKTCKKPSGILVKHPADIIVAKEMGFTLIAYGTELSMIKSSMQTAASAFIGLK